MRATARLCTLLPILQLCPSRKWRKKTQPFFLDGIVQVEPIIHKRLLELFQKVFHCESGSLHLAGHLAMFALWLFVAFHASELNGRRVPLPRSWSTIFVIPGHAIDRSCNNTITVELEKHYCCSIEQTFLILIGEHIMLLLLERNTHGEMCKTHSLMDEWQVNLSKLEHRTTAVSANWTRRPERRGETLRWDRNQEIATT